MEQFISPTQGFVSIYRGIPTNHKYLGYTIFVNHFSDFTFDHLIPKIDGPTTDTAEEAFDRILRTHGVKIKHYHANN